MTGDPAAARKSALALIEDANRWQRAYNNARDDLAKAHAELTQAHANIDQLLAEVKRLGG